MFQQLSGGKRWLLVSSLSLTSALVSTTTHALTLNLLHFSDAESSLLTRTGTVSPTTTPPTTFEYSGVGLFADLIDRQRNASSTDFDLLVTAGDNYLSGPQFQASLSLPEGQQFYDAKALELFNIDVGGIGNHEFDFGPDVLARFIDPEGDGTGFRPFVSSNLIIPDNNPLKGLIQPSTIVTKTVNGVQERLGVVGVTTPLLRSISSPEDVETIGDVVGTPGFAALANQVQTEVDKLTQQGINKVVLVSHLQNINEEKALAGLLKDVDIIVAAGSDTRLANPDDPLLPLTGETPVPSYPLVYDSNTGTQVNSLAAVTGEPVLIVSTDGEYKYLGNLQVEFADGRVTSILEPESGPKRNTSLDGLAPRQDLVEQVQNPVAAFVDRLKQTPVGVTNVPLDSIRTNVRAKSTLAGSLIADAVRDAARDGAESVGLDPENILVGIQNGGGIRNDRRFLPGDTISEFDTFDVLPFSNFVSVVTDITASELLEILERAVSGQTAPDVGGGGQFLQLSGLEVVYDVTSPAQVVTADGIITTPGSRIQSIFLDPDNDRTGQFLYDVAQGGFLLNSDQGLFDLATINFTANGGDNFATLANIPQNRKFTLSGVTYQQALEQYIRGNLGGTIDESDIKSGEGIRARDVSSLVAPATGGQVIVPGDGNGVSVPEPTTLLGLVAVVGLTRLKRRRAN
ncbi:5'-nucleotidase C-terminal domain-containing protein [Funiculus sociatus GB2-A5]|uniref:5'-nucleotidase C-terminal domain-containing protein n=1 Tax=Funiculus sociatus GB2-A5 TaxID=2933946 RepID=A0ABV0JR87_9CYAN|nr:MULTISPECIES: 5'-nucleotidase C-terminal domain-containing protein [unclassified Trichocoleus]MBD1907696.1 5'-nucleotidase C-terminal domain-containing protein [Trichocoleus sp. FACHB-832]MBD2061291.1 5'-nucleotidase C-terminal domain-containing protein [Trichocoleus sp. FACHB-6]